MGWEDDHDITTGEPNNPNIGGGGFSSPFFQDPATGQWIYDPNGTNPKNPNYGKPPKTGGGAGAPVGGTTPTTPTTPGAAKPPGYVWDPPTGTTPSSGELPANWWERFKNIKDLPSLINAIIGAYGAMKPNDWQTSPDPLRDALRGRIYGFIDNSPSRNTFGTGLVDYIKQGNNQPMPMAPNKYGYDPYPNGAPKYDLSRMIPWIQSTMGKNPPPPGSPSGPAPTPGSPTVGGPGGDRGSEETPRSGRTPALPWRARLQSAPAPTQQSAPMPAPSPQASQPQLSQQDIQAFRQFVQQHGKAAGEFVASLIERNPELGVQGAMQMYQRGA